jgi:hypothetical protein
MAKTWAERLFLFLLLGCTSGGTAVAGFLEPPLNTIIFLMAIVAGILFFAIWFKLILNRDEKES